MTDKPQALAILEQALEDGIFKGTTPQVIGNEHAASFHLTKKTVAIADKDGWVEYPLRILNEISAKAPNQHSIVKRTAEAIRERGGSNPFTQKLTLKDS